MIRFLRVFSLLTLGSLTGAYTQARMAPTSESLMRDAATNCNYKPGASEPNESDLTRFLCAVNQIYTRCDKEQLDLKICERADQVRRGN